MAENSEHRFEKTIDSPQEHEEYHGQTLVTQNHGLEFRYQEHTKDGTDSDFFHLVNPSNG